MRPIKFRVWNPELHDMYHAGLTAYFGQTGIIDAYVGHEKAVWMQFTGLLDKNGVEIYEGDLVEHDDEVDGVWGTYEASEVVYNEKYAIFNFKDDSDCPLTSYRNLTVVGNIYEGVCNKEVV